MEVPDRAEKALCMYSIQFFFLFLVFTSLVSIWFKSAEHPWSSATTEPRTDIHGLQQHPNPEVNTYALFSLEPKMKNTWAFVYVFQNFKIQTFKITLSNVDLMRQI